VQALANVQKARAQLEAAANINNLGRGYEQFSGADVTLQVLEDKGMVPNVEGTANPEEVAKYLMLDKGSEAELNKVEAAEDAAKLKAAETPAAQAPPVVGPPAPAAK